MSWTYDSALSTPKDKVRFLIQDINTARQLFQDEEIDWVVSTEADEYTAAAMLAETLVAKAGSVKFKKISEFSIQYDPMFYRGLSTTLRARGAGHQVPYAGGLSVAEKAASRADRDLVQTSVARNMEENPEAPAPRVPSQNPLTEL